MYETNEGKEANVQSCTGQSLLLLNIGIKSTEQLDRKVLHLLLVVGTLRVVSGNKLDDIHECRVACKKLLILIIILEKDKPQ